jgi:hypothetical protein
VVHEQHPVGLGVLQPQADVGPAAAPQLLQRVVDARRGRRHLVVEPAEQLLADGVDQLGLVGEVLVDRGGVTPTAWAMARMETASSSRSLAAGGARRQDLLAQPRPLPRRHRAAGEGAGAALLIAPGSAASRSPTRRCGRRSGPGAHQLARPARRMNAGTSSTRIRVASTTTARAVPTPNS